MLRLVLILVLIVSAPLQGMARGGIDVTISGQNGASVMLAQAANNVLEADDKECCDQTELTHKKSTICKPDCKAVISVVTVAPLKNPSDLGRRYEVIDASFKKPVDLRPPIS